MELGLQDHNGDGLFGANSIIIVVYVDPLGNYRNNRRQNRISTPLALPLGFFETLNPKPLSLNPINPYKPKSYKPLSLNPNSSWAKRPAGGKRQRRQVARQVFYRPCHGGELLGFSATYCHTYRQAYIQSKS